MKELRIILDDDEAKVLMDRKGKKTWKQYLMEK